jgi:hypothetical protein
MKMKTITQAIRQAERILPGTATPEGKSDPRWQAIIEIGEFIESNPNEVWHFARKWGTHRNRDLRMAIATCLLEHLLEYHFEGIFPLVEKAAVRSKRFAETFGYCWSFGQTLKPENKKRITALRKTTRTKRANKRIETDRR